MEESVEVALRGPLVLDRLAIARVVRSKGEELEAIGPCLEGTCDLGRDTDGVERMHVEDLIVELDLAVAPEDHINLLGTRMAVRKGRSLACVQPEVRDSRLLGTERRPGHARLPPIVESVRWRRVLDVVQVETRVRTRHRVILYAVPATPIRLPSGSVNWPTTSVPGVPSGPILRVPPRLSAFCSAASTSGTPT